MIEPSGPRSPNPVDVHVGEKIRTRRKIMRVSQEKLAEALGLTFQQIQKYERGANRVSASKLYEISRFFGTPISYFFEGLADPAAGAGMAEDDPEPFLHDFVQTPEGHDLVRAYMTIDSQRVRRRVLDLCRTLADHTETAPA